MMGMNHQSKMSLSQFGLILTFFFSAFFLTPRSFASVNNDPLSVLQAFIEAQAKGDAPLMMQELGLESLNSQEIENLKKRVKNGNGKNGNGKNGNGKNRSFEIRQ